ncbi:CTLH domain containing protein [Stemphylium lycopersici]|uniref:CTLH domain containing protein n=1 Tax=Stemphylium lycopersici TaxID=183478 RepID=A0A364N082_STELY|nr:ctlh domain-containing protein [Stemphylium lycopersici]RAR08301.1 CTLH domain containing protein [Stemphylium lycopersici]RAR10348.1 CTLH domain containing protein [Stemphylium lycopersici]
MSSSTVSVSAATPTQHPFQRRIDDIKPSKTDINFVIMDYLVSEGYPRAAEKFAKEANIQLPLEEESIQSRVEIRRSIHAGDIDTAITKINDLNPQLIELIRVCTSSATSDITPALNFASSQLAPRAATNQDFLKDLELTMSLLIFLPAAPGTLQRELNELLEPSLRRNVASRVNEAILTSMGAHGESRMRSLVRLRQWAETKARQAGKDLPPSLPLGLQDADERPANGHGEAVDVMVQ